MWKPRLRGDRIHRGDYEMEISSAKAEWIGQKLISLNVNGSDDSGRLAARAKLEPRQSGVAEFQVAKQAQHQGVSRCVRLRRIARRIDILPQPPLDRCLRQNPLWRRIQAKKSVIGRVALANFAYKDVAFSKLTADLSWDGNRTMVRDLRLQQNTGELSADLLAAPNDFRLNLDSTMDPGAQSARLCLQISANS